MKKLALAFATLALLATGCLSDDPEATEPDPTATEVPATIALVHPDSTAGGSDGADSDGTGSDGAGGPGGRRPDTDPDPAVAASAGKSPAAARRP